MILFGSISRLDSEGDIGESDRCASEKSKGKSGSKVMFPRVTARGVCTQSLNCIEADGLNRPQALTQKSK